MRALLQDTLSHSPQFTSFIVLVVGARGLHRNTAARSPPACLAFAVPTLLPHGALAVSVAQVWTAVCKERTGWQGRGTRGRGAGCFIIGGKQNKADIPAHTRTHGHVHMVMTDQWVSVSLITTWSHTVGTDRSRIRCCEHFPICVPFAITGWLLIGAHVWIKVEKKTQTWASLDYHYLCLTFTYYLWFGVYNGILMAWEYCFLVREWDYVRWSECVRMCMHACVSVCANELINLNFSLCKRPTRVWNPGAEKVSVTSVARPRSTQERI